MGIKMEMEFDNRSDASKLYTFITRTLKVEADLEPFEDKYLLVAYPQVEEQERLINLKAIEINEGPTVGRTTNAPSPVTSLFVPLAKASVAVLFGFGKAVGRTVKETAVYSVESAKKNKQIYYEELADDENVQAVQAYLGDYLEDDTELVVN